MDSEDEYIWEPETDPLEIKEEICIKDENIDVIKPELIDKEDSYANNSPSHIQISIKEDHDNNIPFPNFPSYSGITRIVNVTDLLKSDNNALITADSENSKIVPIYNKVPASKNSVLQKSAEKESGCNCMRYIEYYCTKCDTTSFYRKDITQCFQCKTLLKLQCKMCHKRFKFLNSVHQYVLQFSKRLNLLTTSKKEVKFTCIKEQNYFCSKCNFKSPIKELLDKHIKNTHVESTVAITLTANNASNPKSTASIPVETTSTEVNVNKDDNELIELYCLRCLKSCKKVSYDNFVKDVCRECQTEMSYRCTLCLKIYKLLRNIRFHLKRTCRINLNKLQCSDCDYRAEFKSMLAFHIEANHKSIKCSKCYIVFQDNNELVEHITKGCVETQKILAAETAILTDVNANKNIDKFIELYCSKCSKTSRKVTYSKYIKEMCQECQEEMSHGCTLCSKVYKLLRNARYHVKYLCEQQMNLNKLCCSHCDYKADLKSTLGFHIKVNHMPKKCLKCHIEFQNITLLKKHAKNGCLFQTKNEIEDKTPKVKNKIRQHKKTKRNLLTKICFPRARTSFPVDNDDSYTIVQNDPETLVKIISSRPKDLYAAGWKNLIDYYCLQCNGEVKKKFSRYRPWCPNCTIKYDYRCLSCERLYGGYTSIYRHVKNECCNRHTLECSLCDYTSVRKYLLVNHIRTKHTIYKCLRCNCRCDGYMSIKRHQSSECKIENPHGKLHVNKLIALYCTQCNRRSRGFDNDSDSPKACKTCARIMDYQCLKCNKVFKSQHVTFKHVKKECKPNFPCDKCDFKAFIQYDLDIHIKYMHTKRRCPDCGVQFKDDHIFKLHRLEEIRRKQMRKKFLDVTSVNAAKRLKSY